eukprot:10255081-Alexandrium_andersonii.AAC.1
MCIRDRRQGRLESCLQLARGQIFAGRGPVDHRRQQAGDLSKGQAVLVRTFPSKDERTNLSSPRKPTDALRPRAPGTVRTTEATVLKGA